MTMYVEMNGTIRILRAHASFSGDMFELGAEGEKLKEELGLAGEGPNVRIIRHYQTVGCVTKPANPYDKSTRSERYGYRQLLEVTAVRVLLQDGWKLEKIAQFLASLTTNEDLENQIMTWGAFSLPQPSGSPVPASASVGPEGQAALDLLASFRASSGLAKALPVYPAAATQRRTISEYAPALWLRITVDEEAFAKAGRGNIVRVLAEATALLASLNR